jgi:octaprenyl-diphosphate synthase
MVLASSLCGYNGGRQHHFSTIFEYLHAATLLHDDLVDGASHRRGQTAAHQVYGNSTAVLVGDFLLARGLSIAAETKMTKVIEVIAGITENMSQGEIHQLLSKQNLDLTEEEYLEVIRRKTAVLIQGACRVGALISDAALESENALAEFGYNVGVAFQMADDLLDYTADSVVLGKKIGADLREGKLTLPVIHALKNASDTDHMKMKRIILERDFSMDDFAFFVKMLKEYGGIDYTWKRAAGCIEKAKSALSIFESGRARDTLMDIADYALVRKL